MTSIKYFDKPVDIHKIRKTYSDDIEFISDISTYPLITGIAYEGKLHKAIKGKLTSKNVKEKVDKLLESYKQKLYKDWNDNFKVLFNKISIVEKVEDSTKKKEIISSVLAGLGIALSKDVIDFYNQAYLIGKERGVSISGQDFKDEVSAEALDKINSFDQENAGYLKGFMDDLAQKYSDAIDKDYESKQAQEQELERLKKASESRLNLYVPAILGALAVGMTDGVQEANDQNPDQQVTGMIWITQHDDGVCDGCASNDGTFFTFEEFELEYQNNECLTNCRCAESSEPTTENPENFTRSVRLIGLKKGGPGSGRHPESDNLQLKELRPALNDSGRIFIGQHGQTHGDVFNNHENDFNDESTVISGFVDPKGKFYNRHQLHGVTSEMVQEQLKRFDEFMDLRKGGPGSGRHSEGGSAEEEAKVFDQGKGGLEFKYVPVDNVRTTFETNRPINYKKVNDIVESIKTTGKIKPLIATTLDSSRVHLEEGHHRALALKQLGIKQIPFYVVNPEIHNMNNVSGKNFSSAYKKSNVKVSIEPVEKFEKGGEGSGSWDGPGQPRFAFTPIAENNLSISNDKDYIVEAINIDKTPFIEQTKHLGGLTVSAEYLGFLKADDISEPKNYTTIQELKNIKTSSGSISFDGSPDITITSSPATNEKELRTDFNNALNNYPQHLQKIVNLSTTEVRDVAGSNELIGGIYIPKQNINTARAKTIEINRGYKPGFNVDKGMILTHEIAHAVDYGIKEKTGILFSESSMWIDTMKKGTPISRYSMRNTRENFAEHVTAYLYFPEKLKEVNPSAYGVIDNLFKNKIEGLDLKKSDDSSNTDLFMLSDDFQGSLVEVLSKLMGERADSSK